MYITLDEYQKIFHWEGRQWFRDCVVRTRDILYFVTTPEYSEEQMTEEEENEWNPDLRPKAILLFHRSQEAGKQWSGSAKSGWQPMVLGASLKPAGHSVSIEMAPTFPSMAHKCHVQGSGQAYDDKPLEGGFVRGAIGHMKMIDGWLYACTGNRGFGKRLGKGKWQSFSEHFPETENDCGFEDFDAFNERDIYLVGGRGDVWHFDGKKARQIPIPTNINLRTVCCGGDGEVYISGLNGKTFHGRGDRWEKVGNKEQYEDPSTLSFRDMVWYGGKVWATNDYGLWVIENNTINEADVPDWVRDCSGDLSVGDGVLLLSGISGAVFREDGEWHKIVIFQEMEELLNAKKGG